MPATRDNANPSDLGEIKAPQSRCDVCGTVGDVIHVPDRAPPNRYCLRCAVEYGNSGGSDYDDY